MATAHDVTWVVCGIIIVVAVWSYAAGKAVARRRKAKVDISVEIVGDAKVAVDTLRKFGYAKDEAEELVRAAVGQVPDGDYQTIINVALKQ